MLIFGAKIQIVAMKKNELFWPKNFHEKNCQILKVEYFPSNHNVFFDQRIFTKKIVKF